MKVWAEQESSQVVHRPDGAHSIYSVCVRAQSDPGQSENRLGTEDRNQRGIEIESERTGSRQSYIWYGPMELPQPGGVNNLNNINIEPAVQQVK